MAEVQTKKTDPRIPEQVNVRIDIDLSARLERELVRVEKLARCKLTVSDFLRSLIVDGINAREKA